MTDKVQKIRDWISKEQDGLMDTNGNFEYPEHEGAYHILCNLDAYIDSLQEEPNAKFKVGQTITDPTDSTFTFHINKIEDGRYIEKEDEWVLVKEADANYELVEEPVSIWHDASEKPECENLLIETNDGRMIHRQSINNYGMVKRWAYTSELLNLDNSCNLGKNLQEESVSDLGEYINELSKQFPEVSFAKLSRIAVRVAKWQKENLWKPAEGPDLPIFDREIIALLDNGKVVFAHRPNPDGWDGKSLSTGKIEHCTPKTYDKGGWNIPDVKYWLDLPLPEEVDEDESK